MIRPCDGRMRARPKRGGGAASAAVSDPRWHRRHRRLFAHARIAAGILLAAPPPAVFPRLASSWSHSWSWAWRRCPSAGLCRAGRHPLPGAPHLSRTRSHVPGLPPGGYVMSRWTSLRTSGSPRVSCWPSSACCLLSTACSRWHCPCWPWRLRECASKAARRPSCAAASSWTSPAAGRPAPAPRPFSVHRAFRFLSPAGSAGRPAAAKAPGPPWPTPTRGSCSHP